jgi:imidazolonepropionase-like amidohydrolase
MLLWALAAAGGCANALPAASPSWAERDARAKLSVETPPARGEAKVVLAGGTVLTAAGQRFSSGWVAFADGRITAVGEGQPPSDVLEGAQRVDTTGKVVTPGIIDTHSHLGVYPQPGLRAHSDGNEMTDPETAGVWAEHAFWPEDPGIERAVAGGVTTLLALPGSGNLIGGRGVTLHLAPTRGSRAMRFPGAPDALKMACGENPKRVYGGKNRAPMTRMGNVRAQREAFAKAREQLDEGNVHGHDPDLETLVGVLSGEILVHVHCYRADDMLHFVELAKEMGFSVRSFHHAVEAYKIRDILAAESISVSTWADWWGFKAEAYDGIMENAAFVAEAGGRAIIHSDSHRGIQRLNQEAAKALHAGLAAGVALTEDDALRWITANAAWALGIDGEVGTLEAGKRADIVVWDRHPFSVYASAEWVFVDGALRYAKGAGTEPWSDFELGQGVYP